MRAKVQWVTLYKFYKDYYYYNLSFVQITVKTSSFCQEKFWPRNIFRGGLLYRRHVKLTEN